MPDQFYQSDVIIVGGGLAGIVTAYELLEQGKKVLLIEKGKKEYFGGLAKESFGGIHIIGTPEQKRLGILDSPELAYRDWERAACFENDDKWPREWAKFYCENSLEYIYHYLKDKRIEFLPVVNWVERGVHGPKNTLPRWHIVWGVGTEIVRRILNALEAHKNRGLLEVLFEHEASSLVIDHQRVLEVAGHQMGSGAPFRALGDHIVIASGGVSGGDLGKVRQNWDRKRGLPPSVLLNGSHRFADGMLHDQVAAVGGNLTHLERQWLYAAGIHHPAKRKPYDGLSLVPPRSALWMNARGERIGPVPLVGSTDTRFLVDSILEQPGQYSWLVLNWKIAIKELAVSGSDYMSAFRDKNRFLLFKKALLGNTELVSRLAEECPEDFLTARSLPELAKKMNQRSLGGNRVDLEALEAAVREYDDQILRGKALYNDEQLRVIANHRAYVGDRIRLCKFQRILDPKAFPLIAIRAFILTRKSLGGIQTDLQCRALDKKGSPIPGLYAVGEAAGFGGGGIHGISSLEGTFLGSCVLTGRVAGQAIGGARSYVR